MSKIIPDGKTLMLTTILDDFDNDTIKYLEEQGDIVTPELSQTIQAEIDLAKIYINSLKESGQDLTLNSNTAEIKKELDKVTANIHTIVENQKRDADTNEMAHMLMDVSRKLDRIMQEQAAQKAKLSKIELEIKNSQAEFAKKIADQYVVPLVPKDELQRIYDFYHSSLSEIIEKLKTEGILYYKNLLGDDFYKKLIAGYNGGTVEQKTNKMLYYVHKAMAILVMFSKEPKTWTIETSENAELRDDMDWGELDVLTMIAGGFSAIHAPEISNKFINFYNSLYIGNHIPIKVKELRKKGIKNRTIAFNVREDRRYVLNSEISKKLYKKR